MAAKIDPTSIMGIILEAFFAPVMTFDLIMHEKPTSEAACLITEMHSWAQ